jgi:hypothetical protein
VREKGDAMVGYELWEAQSGNLMASYATEADALAAIVTRARLHGAESILSISLLQVEDADDDDDAEMVTLAHGVDLLVRAQAAAAHSLNGPPTPVRVPKSA